MIVVDASAQLGLLLDQLSDAAHSHFDTDLATADLFYGEVGSGLSRSVRHGMITPDHARFLLDQALSSPIESTPVRELVPRAFELRHNVSLYDACYVALAERLGCALLTADARLARSPGLTVPVVLV